MTTTTTTDELTAEPTRGFSAALKAATWSDHRSAESSPFMDALMAGSIDRIGYAVMLAQHLHAYRVLEGAAEVMRHDPVAAPFIDDALTRVPSLERDLSVLVGEERAGSIGPTPDTEAYCERLSSVCTSWPGGFVAHHYTRYLGDLSGGQFIGRIVQRTLDIDASSGAGFFDFPGVIDPVAFKAGYRERLDAAPWDGHERGRIIDEVRAAYRLNTRVFASLDPTPTSIPASTTA